MTRIRAPLVMLAALALWCTPAAAQFVTFTPGNHPLADQENILLDQPGTGLTVFGVTQTKNITVAFASNETLEEPAQGQASIVAADGTLSNLSISIPGGYFRGLIIDPQVGKTAGGTLDILAYSFGAALPDTFAMVLGPGSNFLTVASIPDHAIQRVDLVMQGSGEFAELKQPRIGGAGMGSPPAAVPEPGSVALLLAAVAPGAFWLLRRRR